MARALASGHGASSVTVAVMAIVMAMGMRVAVGLVLGVTVPMVVCMPGMNSASYIDSPSTQTFGSTVQFSMKPSWIPATTVAARIGSPMREGSSLACPPGKGTVRGFTAHPPFLASSPR